MHTYINKSETKKNFTRVSDWAEMTSVQIPFLQRGWFPWPSLPPPLSVEHRLQSRCQTLRLHRKECTQHLRMSILPRIPLPESGWWDTPPRIPTPRVAGLTLHTFSTPRPPHHSSALSSRRTPGAGRTPQNRALVPAASASDSIH